MLTSGPVLIVAGYSGSGKSSLARGLAHGLEASVVEIGDSVRLAHKAAGYPFSVVDFADDAFRSGEPTIFVERAFRDEDHSGLVIAVGIRRREELAWLHQTYAWAKLIWVETPSADRLRRSVANGKGDAEYLARREAIEEAWGLATLRELADLVVDGRRDISDLCASTVAWASLKLSAR